jgi:DNA-directed RNA polymerase subunit RPC12/RpoP
MSVQKMNKSYTYVGDCVTCGSIIQIEVKQNYGKDHFIQCPICNDVAVPSVDLLRVGM